MTDDQLFHAPSRIIDARVIVLIWVLTSLVACGLVAYGLVGTRLRRVSNKAIYVIGTRKGRSDFWMMSVAESAKGLVPAVQIVREFELVQ